MSSGRFNFKHQVVSVAISLILPWVTIPYTNIFAQEETYPNLPQPQFQNVAPTPAVETGEGGATGALGTESESQDSGTGVVGGVLGNAFNGAFNNSLGGLAGSKAGVGTGPDGTTVGNAQLGISIFSSVTTSVLSILGFSLVVTGPLAILGFAIAVAVGAVLGNTNETGVVMDDANQAALDAEQSTAPPGESEINSGPASDAGDGGAK